MKKLILTATVLGMFAISAFAYGGNDAPATVKASFSKLYPNVTKVKWGREKANYEAEFDMNKTEMSCLFDANGNLLETESKISISALPKATADYVAKNYSGEKIKEATKIIDAKKVVTYEAEVKAGDLLFDANGKFLRKVVEAKENGDEKNEKK